MKSYSSMKELAKANNISVRTAFRWMEKGLIQRGEGEDGRGAFILNDDNISDSDMTVSGGTSVSQNDKKVLKDRKPLPVVSPGSGLIQGLTDELEAGRVQFEIEKLNDLKQKWEERRDRERKEKIEAERMQRLDELRVIENQRQAEKKEGEARVIIQQVKNEVLPTSMRSLIPVHIMAFIYQEIEKVLSKMDVLSLPFEELVILGEGIRDRLIDQFSNELRPAVYNNLMSLIRKQFNEVWKSLYQDYLKRGGNLPYRDFILSNIRKYPIEKQRQFLQVIDVSY